MLIHTIAAVLLELSYLCVGLLLCLMGQRLLERSVTGSTKIEGEIAGGTWKLLTTSPGIVYAICGLGIILYAIITPSVYEEKVNLMENITQLSHKQDSSAENQYATAMTTTKSSKLFTQPTENAGLRSRLAIYALLHKESNIINENVAADIKQMPAQADDEKWEITYKRFRDILKKNPAALTKMLNQSQFKWLVIKDMEDFSLTSLVETEYEQLNAKIISGEIKQ